jgi:hypothetical protein
MNKDIAVVVQSYPAFRIVYHLINNDYKVHVLSSNSSVLKYCQFASIDAIHLECKLFNHYLIRRTPFKYLLNYIYVKKELTRIININKFTLLFTILGLEIKILPAVLSLKEDIYFWDDSYCVTRIKSNSVKLKDFIKLKIFNIATNNNFKYYRDTSMHNFLCMDKFNFKKNIKILPDDFVINKKIPFNISCKIKKSYYIVLLGDYSLYSMSLKINIAKLLNLIEEIKIIYKEKLFYKPHPGSSSVVGLDIFEGRIIDEYIPIETMIDSIGCIISIGSASSITVANSGKLLGLGTILDLRSELKKLSSTQGLFHVADKSQLFSQINFKIDQFNFQQ